MYGIKTIFGIIALLAALTPSSATPTLAATPRKLYDARSIAQSADQAQTFNLVKRDGNCTDGTGTYSLAVTAKNIDLDQYETYLGRLPSGSSITTQGNEATYGILTSVEVDAGFFELFSRTVGMPVSSSYAVYIAPGVKTIVNCPLGIDGIIYNVPVYTEYLGVCTSDDNREIDVYIPNSNQNQFRVQCLYAG